MRIEVDGGVGHRATLTTSLRFRQVLCSAEALYGAFSLNTRQQFGKMAPVIGIRAASCKAIRPLCEAVLIFHNCSKRNLDSKPSGEDNCDPKPVVDPWFAGTLLC